ncbi:type VI secretion system tip protein VgrG [Dickeya lacustris]|uniref:Type VI secretion system tip protein VgrG n=1 Tax=Dickeya lacustris TaxID=2259638 RepID=A0ABY8G4Q5_9GAMM|nr:type VI secretion system tip protein VgrG [Dickeya lacustris]WFN54936.1 type VI secretion system tip protein VgrG [Dickeya lacustris]
MADSPAKNSDGVVTCTLHSNGRSLGSDIPIIAIDVEKHVNRIARARIVIADGDMPQNRLPLSDDSLFLPGNTLSLYAGYASQEQCIFSGVIVRHGIRIDEGNQPQLVIDCRDSAIGMTLARRNDNYLQQSDSDIWQQLIGRCAGVSAAIARTSGQHGELVQFHCTDWDFLLARAEANAMVICNEDNKITIAPPCLDGSAQLTLTYGEDIIALHADIDARYQFRAVTSVGWDPASQQPLSQQAAALSVSQQGNLSADKLAGALGLEGVRLQSATPLSAGALQHWARGQQVKSALSRLCGTLTCQGTARARLNTLVALTGVGARFNGNLYVSGIRHQISQGQWLTHLSFGMPALWSAEHRDLAAPPASGLLPAVEGLQIGIVKQLDGDPAKQHRIQVSVPVMQAEHDGIWARLASYYASNGIGAQFVPEIGDEVVLGYFNNNPSDPVVLGSLYSSKNPPPLALEGENRLKTLLTRSQLSLQFDDKEKSVTLLTPGGNQWRLSDKDKTVALQDQHGNRVTLNDSGITLESPKDITLNAKGQITLNAARTVDISAKGDLSAQGMNVSLSAKTAFSAKGSATAELTASGQTVVKGGIVMIN